ncbi:MAG: indole-3-glycerol phosphate synthase TrpC [Bryobacteraceae bacterium]
MVSSIPDILARIVARKREELDLAKPTRPALERIASDSIPARRDFAAALASDPPAIIAEIKKASPSKGVLSPNFDPAAIAKSYASGGAAALSVLTDRDFFQGSLEDLAAARVASGLPVLRKDFTIDEFHVVEAAAHGADAILLIAAILTPQELRRFRELAEAFRMASLVEVHNEAELVAALDSGARIVGVNNRDLHTFDVTLETAIALAPRIPADVIRVAESGIHSATDVARLRDAGFSAFLVGEHLMKSGDPAAAIRNLRQ